ncbi:PREDICTED: sorting nexin-13-like isoform X2 [Nicrophorus vespilloides]|uniref:Sorting nexin-13-like isoform X2 n=1 Tax=Nicrophorus vespilloides TaxID=110193 RepID=A0ABM1M2E4_NICVS|nr:PREDICTED: sorting nexin-13-like isoform X2 [Nicrophorus vespilloides]
MDSKSLWWCILIVILVFTSFGIGWSVTLFITFSTFLIGNYSGNPLSESNVSDGGLQQVVQKSLTPNKLHNSDHRVTGSELIDTSLQEILGYVIRDYVSPWYNLISTNEDLPQKSVRKSAQKLAINISNRVKEVDWIPYLTTRLVDDAASHLKLFKQARAKMKQEERPKSPRNSPRRETRISPKRTHKRNKSETDIAWYFGSRNSDKKDVEYTVGHTSKFYVNDSGKQSSLEDYFFDLECTMENNAVCRDLICTDDEKEKEFLSELVELLLYILLPDKDFQCKPLRFILRELFSNCVILPLFSMLSDPDYINQAILWLCLREVSLPSEIFLSTLRTTNNCDELKYTKQLVSSEIQLLRSRDSGGDSDLSIKQQLSSLFYVIKIIDNRLSKIDNNENLISYSDYYDFNPLENDAKSIDLPLDFILKNNVALSYFIDYTSSLSKQDYLFFYLNIEGWKVSVEQQLSDIQINKMKGLNENSNSVYENIRSTAMNIYEQYLGDKDEHKVDISATLIHKLFFRIRNLTEAPSELWFDDVQKAIYEKMKVCDEFLPQFKKSKSYIKLLEELDLLQQTIVDEDTISLSSLDNLEVAALEEPKSTNNGNLHQKQNYLTVEGLEKSSSKHVRSLSDVTCFMAKPELHISDSNLNGIEKIDPIDPSTTEKLLKTGDFALCVKIIETGIVCEKGKTFGIYATHVSRQYDTGFLEEWHIYRRYSDFHDLHTKIKERYPDLSKIAFPGKKTFHNMDRAVLERRMKMLGLYMQELTQSHIVHTHHGLRDLLMTFLEQGDYDRVTSGGPISHTIDTIVNPIKTGMKTIKNMPEQLIHTVDEVVEKVFHQKTPQKQQQPASKVGAALDIESDDNIPLRIMLLLVDEVFDLKSRNQWLRRRIVTILRQIVRTMFGDIVNRRILDYVSFITSPKNVAHYLHVFKQSFWPNGVKAERKPDRDEGSKYRTRVAAKIALLSCLTDELKHIIGSETTRKGLLSIFELFQRPILNRRLIYVLLEGILSNLFPEKNITEIFHKLHSKSRRHQEKQKELVLKIR